MSDDVADDGTTSFGAGDEAATTIRSRVINEIKELIHQIEEFSAEINLETGSLGADADVSKSKLHVNQAIGSAKAAAAAAKPKLQGISAAGSVARGHPLMASQGQVDQELSEAIVFALKQLEDASKGFEAAVVAHSKRTTHASTGSLEVGNPAANTVYHETSTRMAAAASTVISSARSPFGAAQDPEAQERRASGRERLLGNQPADRRLQRRVFAAVASICIAIAIVHHRLSMST
mmetsp:Transcript_41698/g.95703  ORF Transcript_41698/g.95703 Transcript_41698/m.95703 type:complete len:235 (+) Transcript_41698:57-761(+)